MKTNRIALFLTACLAFACGSAEDLDAPDLVTAGDEIDLGTAPSRQVPNSYDSEFGMLEQKLSVNSSKYCITTGASHPTCRSDGSAGQVCLCPTSKTIEYCYSNAGGAWSNQEITDTEFAQGNIAGDFTGFTFVRTAVGNQTNCANSAIVNQIRKGTCSGSVTSDNIDSFVCYTPREIPGAPGNLTETLPGSWRKMQGGVIVVDFNKLGSRTSPTVGDQPFQSVRQSGITHALAQAAGFGEDTTVVNATLHTSRKGANAEVLKTTATSQEKCFAASVNPGGGGGGGFLSFNATTCP